MLYKNKTPYGERVIEVTEILPEKEGQESDWDRVFYICQEKHERYMYAETFKRDYEPIPENTLICPHCGILINAEHEV